MKKEFREWAIEQHRSTNHKYADILPYEFHLLMCEKVFDEFKHLITSIIIPDDYLLEQTYRNAVIGHDLLEDCRVTYNDLIANGIHSFGADIIYAVTNEKGKNRAERANEKYYTGIRETEGAVFVKLCDRIANVRYSKMMGSRMFEMYRKENVGFIEKLGFSKEHPLFPMFYYLNELFL